MPAARRVLTILVLHSMNDTSHLAFLFSIIKNFYAKNVLIALNTLIKVAAKVFNYGGVDLIGKVLDAYIDPKL